MAVSHTAGATVTVTWTGLVPTTEYESSWTFTPSDGSDGFEVGQNSHKVGAGGSYVTQVDWHWVSGGNPGHYRAWLRPKGSYQDAAPSNGPDGEPLAVEFDIPEV